MNSPDRGQILRDIDYSRTFKFTSIFRSFKIATQPGKMTIALGLVVIMFVVGWLLDGLVGGGRVLPGEFEQFIKADSVQQFQDWRTAERDAMPSVLADRFRKEANLDFAEAEEIANDPAGRWQRAREAVAEHYAELDTRMAELYDDSPDDLADYRAQASRLRSQAYERIDRLRPGGVFNQALNVKINAFHNLINAARQFRFGFSEIDPRAKLDLDNPTIFGSVRLAAYELPAWLWNAHPWFFAIWLLVFVAVWSLLGGAISRLTVVDAATGDRLSMSDGMHYAYRRWLNYALSPLLPLIVVALIALLIAGGGLLFHVPGLDIVGAVLIVFAIPLGLLMAFFLIGWVGSVHLMYPALSAEGTDAFDSISRSYSYVLARPWRFILYALLSLGYGVATYLFVGLFVFLTLYLVQVAGSAWAPLDRIFPSPQLGQLTYEVDTSGLATTERIAAVIVKVYVFLTIGLVAAYAISFYFSAWSLVYLIMRHRCDGTDMSEVYIERDPAADAPPKVEATEPTVDRADET